MSEQQPPTPYGAPVPAHVAYGHPPPFYPGGPSAPPEPTKTLAIVALVLAIVPCGITSVAAIVLGIIVLVNVKKGTVIGQRLAVAALVISVLWLAASAAAIALIVKDSNKYDAARAANAGTVGSDMVRTGDCLADLPDSEVITTIEILPCARSHRGEVYARFTITAGQNPSQQHIYGLADDGCRSRIQQFLGSRSGDNLRYGFIAPDKDAASDDDVACYLFTNDRKQTTGSLKGVGK